MSVVSAQRRATRGDFLGTVHESIRCLLSKSTQILSSTPISTRTICLEFDPEVEFEDVVGAHTNQLIRQLTVTFRTRQTLVPQDQETSFLGLSSLSSDEQDHEHELEHILICQSIAEII